MKIRLFLAVMSMLFLPSFFSSSLGENAAPFNTVAIAGHTTSSGKYCSCADCEAGCICDPGEPRGNCGLVKAPSPSGGKPGKGASQSPDLDYGTGAMVLALALFVWLRLRA